MSIRGLLGLLLLLALGAGGFWIVGNLTSQMAGLIGGVLGFVASSLVQSARENKSRLYEKKCGIYARLIDPYVKMQESIISAAGRQPLTQEQTTALFGPDFIRAKFDAMLYASDEVIQTFLQLDSSARSGSDIRATIALYTRLLKAMRKDLGHPFSTVGEADLLGMVVQMTPEERKQFQAVAAATKRLPTAGQTQAAKTS